MAKDGDVPQGGTSKPAAGKPVDLTFASGVNAAYVENLYARYAADPAAVSPDWRAYFSSLGDDAGQIARGNDGPSWGRKDWPPRLKSEETALLDGDWPTVEKAIASKIETRSPGADGARVRQETRDSISALICSESPGVGHHQASANRATRPPLTHGVAG